MAGESAEQRTDSLRRSSRAATCPRRASPAGPRAGGPSRDRRSPELGELQLRLDFDAVAAAAGRSRAHRTDRRRRVDRRQPARPRLEPARGPARPRSPRRSSIPAGSRSAAPTGSPTSSRGSPRSRGRRRRCCSTTRGRAAGPRSPSPSPARDGRVVAADGAEAADALRHLLERLGTPARRPRGQAGPRRGLRRGRGRRRRTPVAFDTQIAAYILNAALRSQTIADVVAENLDQILPPRDELPATARAGLEALSALAVREPLERRLAGDEPRSAVPRDRAAADPGPRPDGGGRRRARSRGARRARPGVRGRDRAARAGDLRRRRARVQPRQPQAARAGPLLRAQPAQGQADEDRLLDRRLGARGPSARPPDDRQAPRVADLHEAPLDLRRGAADAARRRRPPPHDVPPGRRRRPAACPRPTRTSRTSRSGPTLGRRIRRAFVAGDPDRVLLAADYSQIELRILAHVSGDEHLKDAFARGADIHRETAARVLHKDPADITHGERSMAKMVNFGLAYGMSDFGLASRANIPREGGAGVHQLVLRGLLRDQLLHDGDQGAGQGAGLGRDAARPQARRSRSCARRTRRSAGPASGWRSTCRSRGPPRTSRRSR